MDIKLCVDTQWLMLPRALCARALCDKIWARSRQMGRTMPVSQRSGADLKRKIFWCLLARPPPMEVALSPVTVGQCKVGTLCAQNAQTASEQCTSAGSSIAQSITMSQPALWQSALWQSARSPQDTPSPICNSLSETLTSDLQHFKHLQNLQLAGAVSDLQHLAPPQSHLVSIIAFHSSHLVSNCN